MTGYRIIRSAGVLAVIAATLAAFGDYPRVSLAAYGLALLCTGYLSAARQTTVSQWIESRLLDAEDTSRGMVQYGVLALAFAGLVWFCFQEPVSGLPLLTRTMAFCLTVHFFW